MPTLRLSRAGAARGVLPPRRAASPRAFAAHLVVAASLACGGGTDDTAADPPVARALPAPPPTAAPADSSLPGGTTRSGDDACRLAGLWQRCSVVESLERAGFATELLRDSVRQPGLTIEGSAYRVGAAELQLFLYADSAGARREAAAVRVDDAEAAVVPDIRRPPAVIRTNNLVALLFDNNDRQRERVQLALTAGLPPG